MTWGVSVCARGNFLDVNSRVMLSYGCVNIQLDVSEPNGERWRGTVADETRHIYFIYLIYFFIVDISSIACC